MPKLVVVVFVSCIHCHGRGRVTCSLCAGNGKVKHYLRLKVDWYVILSLFVFIYNIIKDSNCAMFYTHMKG